MYTAFYGLREKPFALSPDPRFLYLAGSHREALAHLLYGIEQGEGFISVTGEVGTGKTTLCRTLLERLDGDTELAFLFNPSRTALELLQSICAELDLPAEGLTRRALMSQLNHFLLEQKRAGRRVLLIIDEAQTLSDSTLEQVRLLSNLETSREKLIQILLLGQPELDRKLDTRALRQLRQRISVRWQLEPLSAQETRAYVRHRLAVAAGEPRDLFSEAALREIHRRTGGVPRLVNQLCDRALLAGYAARTAQIGPRLVRAAAREIPDARRIRDRGHLQRLSRPWPTVVASLVLLGLSLFAGIRVGRDGLSQGLRAALFKPAAEQSAGTPENGLPPVSAGAARSVGRPGATVDDPDGRVLVLPGDEEGPPVAELIGYLPEELRESIARLPGPLATPEGSSRDVDPNAPFGSGASALASPMDAERAGEGGRLVASSGTLAIPLRPAPETALAPGLLGRMLVAREAAPAIADSERALLERFGRRVPALSKAAIDQASLTRSLRGRGLAATAFDGGSLALLERLDHPFAIPLSPYTLAERAARAERAVALAAALDGDAIPSGDAAALAAQTGAALADQREKELAESRWIAVVGFDGDRARVSGLVDGRRATVPIEEIERHWLESGLIVWERFESVATVLRPEDEGDGVLWLQRALAELRLTDARPTGRYDEATSAAVGRFQQQRGLVADGVAGPLTQIALYAGLDRYPVPRLSRIGTSESLPAVSAGPDASAPVEGAAVIPDLSPGGAAAAATRAARPAISANPVPASAPAASAPPTVDALPAAATGLAASVRGERG